MQKKLKIICLIVIIIISFTTIIYAGDMIYHFMQPHQDYVIIAKIIEKKSKNQCMVEVSELIKESSIREDIPLKIVINSDNNVLEKYDIGDNIAVSLNKRGGGYKIENGIYKISTNNTDSLEVIDVNNISAKGDLVAIEMFLKSRGKIKQFYFTEDKVYIQSNAFKINENDICIYSEENGKILPLEFEKNEKYIVKDTKNYFSILLIIFIIVVIIFVIVLYVIMKKNFKVKNKIKKFLKKLNIRIE